VIAVSLLVGGGVAAATADAPALTRDRDFAVTAPADGDRVASPFVLSWAPGDRPAPGGYAVVVDAPAPAPGRIVRPGPRTLLLKATSLQLGLGEATKGSPSARRFHVISVLKLDAAGRRTGEDAAVVHVRAAP
jgi:hypothetical protein